MPHHAATPCHTPLCPCPILQNSQKFGLASLEGRVFGLAGILREAFAIAQSGRPGPVLVDIPKNVTAETADYEPQQPKPAEETPLSEETEQAIRELAQMILEYERVLTL